MRQLRESIVTILTLAACALPAHADDASPWVNDLDSSLRLIAGGASDGDALRAGVEIKLKPGWHTYWRYPGDSGVPPRFSFPGSDNVATVKVLYPAPQAIVDETGTTIGYTDNVVFPLRVTPRQKGKPVKLHLNVDYAVCEKLCLPVEAKAELALPGGNADTEAIIAAAEARVPHQVSAADIGLDRASRQRRVEAAGGRRYRRRRWREGADVRRRPDGRVGAAHPETGARRSRRPPVFRLRARRPAAGRRSERAV